MTSKTDSSAAIAAFLARGGKVTTIAAAGADTVKRSQSQYWRDVRHFNETGERPADRAARMESAADAYTRRMENGSREQAWSEYDSREHANGDL